MSDHRCQHCEEAVDPDDEDVIDEQIPGGPRITDHKECARKAEEEAMSKLGDVEPPEGGWAKYSDMDRL